MTDLIDLSKMIRPWYRGQDTNSQGSYGDHIYPDCEELANEGGPREGVGWLDPYGSDVCETCRERHDPAAYAEWASEVYEWAPIRSARCRCSLSQTRLQWPSRP